MYTAPFEYHRASSVDEALALLRQYGDDAKLIAGGHSLIPVMKLRFAQPAHLIDIRRIDALSGIREQADGVVIGSGQLESTVEQFALRVDPKRFIHRRWVAYPRLPNRIAQANCVLGIFGTTPKAGRVIPNKVYQAMAMGAPIITRDSPAVRKVLTDGESALLVQPGDPEALARAVAQMGDTDLRGRLGAGARAAFERYGSDAANLGEIREMIQQLIPQQCPERVTADE
jgi:glycosyltransferase involved in cell wall biosynthesis